MIAEWKPLPPWQGDIIRIRFTGLRGGAPRNGNTTASSNASVDIPWTGNRRPPSSAALAPLQWTEGRRPSASSCASVDIPWTGNRRPDVSPRIAELKVRTPATPHSGKKPLTPARQRPAIAREQPWPRWFRWPRKGGLKVHPIQQYSRPSVRCILRHRRRGEWSQAHRRCPTVRSGFNGLASDPYKTRRERRLISRSDTVHHPECAPPSLCLRKVRRNAATTTIGTVQSRVAYSRRDGTDTTSI